MHRSRRKSLQLLSPRDYEFVEAGFRKLLPVGGGVEEHLGDVITDALAHPGSLVRAQLAYGVMRGHDVAPEQALRAACAIEYFHTASLIFDDLPSMDNATERRGRTCPHVVHGEASATLGALAFVNQGYALLWEVLGQLDSDRGMRAARLVAGCLGPEGILNGQARDLQFKNHECGAEDVLQVAAGKTVPLIRLTLSLPAIVGGAGERTLELLDRLSEVWGLSYQIVDDFKDCLMTREETGKSTSMDEARDRPNLPGNSGLDGAMRSLSDLLSEGRETLDRFRRDGSRWEPLERVQAVLERETEKIRLRIRVKACA